MMNEMKFIQLTLIKRINFKLFKFQYINKIITSNVFPDIIIPIQWKKEN